MQVRGITSQTLEGVIASILITAGPTREYLDDVRFLSNASSGRMGYALAEAAIEAGHETRLVAGPTQLLPPKGALVLPTVSALEMQAKVLELVPEATLFFAAAAVSDHRPRERAPGKPAKQSSAYSLELVPNPDILGDLGQRRAAGELDLVLVGFALEAGGGEEALKRGQEKLRHKQLDLIVVNQPLALGSIENRATLLFADGRQESLPRMEKAELARRLLREGMQIREGGQA